MRLSSSRESIALSDDSESRAARQLRRLGPCERAGGPRAEVESAEGFLRLQALYDLLSEHRHLDIRKTYYAIVHTKICYGITTRRLASHTAIAR